ncbi:MAG: sigma 54-interacting transcriptional regulator, partial [Planctomycetota bacterium]
LADTGTLFLDEIGTATQAMQVKLLRVLQQLQFEALGGTETKTVDTRVILATNEDLSAAVARGDFRQDLFYRINVVNIAIPPLRERRGDIPLLVEHFLRGATETCGRDVEGFDADAMEMLHQYSWPGNVRELENVVQRAVLLGRDNVLGVHDLPVDVAKNRPSTMHGATTSGSDSGDNRDLFNSGPAPAPVSDPMALIPASMEEMTLREALEGPEREIILRSLRLHHWNRIATADALGINRTTLYKKMKRLGLDDPRLQMAR